MAFPVHSGVMEPLLSKALSLLTLLTMSADKPQKFIIVSALLFISMVVAVKMIQGSCEAKNNNMAISLMGTILIPGLLLLGASAAIVFGLGSSAKVAAPLMIGVGVGGALVTLLAFGAPLSMLLFRNSYVSSMIAWIISLVVAAVLSLIFSAGYEMALGTGDVMKSSAERKHRLEKEVNE